MKNQKEEQRERRRFVKYTEELRELHKQNKLPKEIVNKLRRHNLLDFVTGTKQVIPIEDNKIDVYYLIEWIQKNKRLPLIDSKDFYESDLAAWHAAKIAAKKEYKASTKKKKTLYFDHMWDFVAEEHGMKGLFDEGFRL